MRRRVISTLFCCCAITAMADTISPRLRPSPYFGSLTGLAYANIDELGSHNYERSSGEKNPLIYTAKGGYIDIGHLRESADRARYLFEICRKNILKGSKRFSYKVIEPASYMVTVEFPENWDQLSEYQHQAIAREVSIELGQHFAQVTTIWHEIVTWYGYASTGLLSEQPSSFSWEDSYSDLLGTKLGAMALRENGKPYNESMTEIIYSELSKLDPQPIETARQATETIDGKWFFGRYPFLKMKKRNFDVGFDDEAISPFRVPGICPNTEPVLCQVPPLDALEKYGFNVSLQMKPKESERQDIFKIISSDKDTDTLHPQRDFPVIIAHIRELAINTVGPDVDKPTL